MKNFFDFKGMVVIVTGGASGIGKATTFAFSECGARVVIFDINEKEGKQLGGELEDETRNVFFLKVDVSSREEVDRAVAAVLQKFGKISILVNNAGIEFNNCGSIVDMPREKMVQILNVNLGGYINCVISIVPIMHEGGRIVNVSSVQGIGAILPGTSYQVSKAGILGLTHALAIELAPRGITVNTVVPGAIATEGMGAMRNADPAVLKSYRRRIPMGRRGFANEVAWPILFLCSGLASYITGIAMPIDGGYLINLNPDTGAANIVYGEDPDE